MIERCRRRPRKTQKNQSHAENVWGSKGKVNIMIPKLIDDYNHWMGGVDLYDQHISYYHPNIRCRRNWVPTFIQMLSIIRSNSYIVHKSYLKKISLSHKEFTREVINCLMNKAIGGEEHKSLSTRSNSTITSSVHTPPNLIVQQSLRMKREMQSKRIDKNQRQKQMKMPKNLPLDEAFPLRKHTPRSLHKRVKGDFDVKPACVYCAWKYQNSPTSAKTMTYSKAVSRTQLLCYYCNTYLCRKCFDWFHDTTGMPPP